MSDSNRPEQSIEERLAEYGAVLRAELDDDGAGIPSAAGAAPVFLLDRAAPASAPSAAPKRSAAKPAAIIVSIAAAIVLLVGVVVPGLSDRSTDSITITDLDVADQPGGPDGGDGDGAGSDHDDSATKAKDAETDGEVALASEDADKGADELDWSAFTVRAGTDSPGHAESEVGGSEADDPSGSAAVLAAESDGEAAGDDKPAEPEGDTKPDADGGDDEDKEADDRAESDGEKPDDETTDEKPEDDGVDGDTPPSDECPADAVTFGGECYEIVPPSCGDLEVSPAGDGCLKLVGSAGAGGGCPGAYELDGDTCVKLLPADASCAEGVPADGACLIKFEATGSGGCSAGQLEIGGSCYELSAPTSSSCGDMPPLGDGQCRYAVSGESPTSCPAGFEPLGGEQCYRYEEPAEFSCAEGEPVGDGCKVTESGTPGPDVCPDGVEEDGAGCFILVDRQEDGTCGGLPEAGDKCRKDKASIPTWTCADGTTVYDNVCYRWTDATITCAAGEPVGGDSCKTIVDAVASAGCPDWALEDAQGCYKIKPAELNCGDLHVAPDGVNCKQWVGEAAGGECPGDYDLVGSYCKKYVDGAASCSGATLVELAGNAMCRYTQAPGETGCAAGQVEKAGECYLLVAPSCQDLDVDVFGTGCKKPVS